MYIFLYKLARCLRTKLCSMQKNVRYVFYGPKVRRLLRQIQRKAHSGLRGRILHSSFPSRSRGRLLIFRIDSNSSTFSSYFIFALYNIKLRKSYTVGKCEFWRKLFLPYARIYHNRWCVCRFTIFITKVVKARYYNWIS